MGWSEALVLILTSSVSSVAIKEGIDVIRGRTRVARELADWQVWGITFRMQLAKDGVDVSKYPEPPKH